MPQPESRFRATSGCQISEMDDGFVVYDPTREFVHYLNPVGAIVYHFCTLGEAQADMALAVQSAFALPVPPHQEIASCLDELLAQGLISPC